MLIFNLLELLPRNRFSAVTIYETQTQPRIISTFPQEWPRNTVTIQLILWLCQCNTSRNMQNINLVPFWAAWVGLWGQHNQGGRRGRFEHGRNDGCPAKARKDNSNKCKSSQNSGNKKSVLFHGYYYALRILYLRRKQKWTSHLKILNQPSHHQWKHLNPSPSGIGQFWNYQDCNMQNSLTIMLTISFFLNCFFT